MLTNSYSSVWICFCHHFSLTSYCQVWGFARVPQEECLQTGFQECFIPFMVIFTGCLGAGLHQADLRLPAEQHHLHHGTTLRCWEVELLNVILGPSDISCCPGSCETLLSSSFRTRPLTCSSSPCWPLPPRGWVLPSPPSRSLSSTSSSTTSWPHHSQHHVFVINIIINTIFTSIIVFIIGIIIITGLSTSWSQSSFSSSQMLRWQTHFVKNIEVKPHIVKTYWGDKPILFKTLRWQTTHCFEYRGDKPILLKHIEVTNTYCLEYWGDKPTLSNHTLAWKLQFLANLKEYWDNFERGCIPKPIELLIILWVQVKNI